MASIFRWKDAWKSECRPQKRGRCPNAAAFGEVGATGFEPATSCAQVGPDVLDGVSSRSTHSQALENTESPPKANPDALAPPFTKTTFLGEPVVNGFRPIETLLSAAEVARQLGVHRATVYKLVERGELAHVRIRNAVRVRPEDLENFIHETRSRGDG